MNLIRDLDSRRESSSFSISKSIKMINSIDNWENNKYPEVSEGLDKLKSENPWNSAFSVMIDEKESKKKKRKYSE